MPDDQLIERIENALEKDQAGLEAELPGILAKLDGRTDDLVREHPEMLPKVLARVQELDVASFVAENPDLAGQFQALLWSGMDAMVEQNPAVKERITEDITANFAADDCPLEGHLRVDEATETITGSAGRVDDADIEITGPADVLVGLVTGTVEPARGFLTGRFVMDGSLGTATKLGSVMSGLSG